MFYVHQDGVVHGPYDVDQLRTGLNDWITPSAQLSHNGQPWIPVAQWPAQTDPVGRHARLADPPPHPETMPAPGLANPSNPIADETRREAEPVVKPTGPAVRPAAGGVDLAGQLPGHAVLAHIWELLESPQAPKAEDLRSWAVGFVGEEQVGAQLALLGPGWWVLHAVPRGSRVADTDHLVIGPPGVVAINTKHHDGAMIQVRGEAAYVGRSNRAFKPYIPRSRQEAEQVAKHLEAAGCQVPVKAFVCTVGAVLNKDHPAPGVTVIDEHHLVPALLRLPVALTPEEAAATYEVARWSSIWPGRPVRPAPTWVAARARAIAATAAASRSASRRARPPVRKQSGRTHLAPPTRVTPLPDPARVLRRLALVGAALAAILFGPGLLASALSFAIHAAIPGRTSPAPTTTTSAPDQYPAASTLPMGFAGAPCPKPGSQARSPFDDLLICRPDTDADRGRWVYADPWLRLPAGLAKWPCDTPGSHARPITGDRIALVCVPTGANNKWQPDPGWTPPADVD